MQILQHPTSRILSQGDDMYKVDLVVNRGLFTNNKNVINKIQLGYLVKWLGAEHVVQDNQKLIVCTKIQDADYEIITDEKPILDEKIK